MRPTASSVVNPKFLHNILYMYQMLIEILTIECAGEQKYVQRSKRNHVYR